MTRPFPALAAALLAAAPFTATATASAQVTHDPRSVQSGTYAVDPDHTQIIWGVSHLGFTTFYGQFKQVAGTLVLSPEAPASSRLDVTFPIASVFTSSPKLDGELVSPDWLDAGKFPDARFQSTSIAPAGPDGATITGNLTFHGVTKPVTLNAKFVGAGRNPMGGYNVGFSATGSINRSEFGVTKYVPLVGDQVELTISGAFVKS